MVHQHFMLIPVMTVAENIVLADEPTRQGVLLDMGEAERRVREISDRYGLAVDPDARIQDITVGQQQRVEILKALYRDADILVLDEPTAVLTPQEAKELFEIVRALTARGKSIIFITHKLNEVLEIADRITVLRRGKLIETLPAEGATEESLARADGRPRGAAARRQDGGPARRSRCSRSRTSSVLDDRGIEKVRGVSFERARGRDRRHRRHRRQRPDGADRRDHGPAERRRPARCASTARTSRRESAHGHLEAGLGHIPEDRQRRGLVLEFSIAENIALHDYRAAARLAASAGSSRGRLVERARKLIKEFDVRGGGPRRARAGSPAATSRRSSLAREIDRDPKVLIAAQPTRGLDVGAIEFVHRRLIEERDEGRAILLVSLELEEVLSLSDRILVIYEGEIVGEFPPTATRGGARHRDDRRRARRGRRVSVAASAAPRAVPASVDSGPTPLRIDGRPERASGPDRSPQRSRRRRSDGSRGSRLRRAGGRRRAAPHGRCSRS